MGKLHQFFIGDKVALSEEALSGDYKGTAWISGAVGLVGIVSTVRSHASGEGVNQGVGVDWVGARRDLEGYTYHNSWLQYLGSTIE